MAANLYNFTKLNCTNAGAPRATPVSYASVSQNGNGYIQRDSLSNVQTGIINVVNDFQWTTSPPGASSRQEVPRIELREKRLKTNSVIAAAAYYLMSVSGTAGTLLGRTGSAPQGASVWSTLDALFNSGSSAIGNFFGRVGNSGKALFESSLLNSASKFFTGQDLSSMLSSTIEGLGDPLLEPYDGLYITEDTKFSYVLPYFNDLQVLVQNSFNVNDEMLTQNTLLGRTINTVRSAAESLARMAHFTEPGLYIERPKFYQFKQTGDTVTFSFPLINTGFSTYDDVRLNWQLVFLLTYQNRPNRRTRELIDPACIYEVNIPGVKYIPFAFISNLKIDYLGARRQMELDVPTQNGAGTIVTIVPDAYIVTITLEGLVADTQNFLASMLGGKQDVVSVVSYDQFNPFSQAQDIFEQNLGRAL